MADGPTRRLIWDLIGMGVGMEVGKDGRPHLTVPPHAEAMVRSNLDAIRGARDDIVAAWSEVAAAWFPVWVCKECEALVLDPEQGSVSRWTFCEFPSCPYRTDEAARAFKASEYQRARLAEGRRAKFLAENPQASEVPD